jgi:hypothetical protein
MATRPPNKPARSALSRLTFALDASDADREHASSAPIRHTVWSAQFPKRKIRKSNADVLVIEQTRKRQKIKNKKWRNEDTRYKGRGERNHTTRSTRPLDSYALIQVIETRSGVPKINQTRPQSANRVWGSHMEEQSASLN